MEYANRKFRNNRTGEIVKVIDTFENIAILENKQKVDVRSLSDPTQYTEEIDPSSFFNTQGAYNALAEKIKNIPTHMMNDEPEEIVSKFGGEINPLINESAIVMTTEEDEKAELARKYGVNVDNSSQLENNKYENARQIFLFSVFSNGLRFSDTATLRFCDFEVSNFNGKISNI